MEVSLIKEYPNRIMISIEGVIDSSNADIFYNEVSKLRKNHIDGVLILDFDKVNYISSAGLRALLKLQKEDSKIIIVKNVSDEIMKIMIVSGFDNILLVERKYKNIENKDSVSLERINLDLLEKYTDQNEECLAKIESNLRTANIDGSKELAKGTKGVIYRFDDDKIIKVFYIGTALKDVVMERNLSKKALLLGLPTAITYDIVKVEDSYGVVFEMLNADTLSQAINKYPENYDNYLNGYEGILKKLHSTTTNDITIPSAKNVYLGYIEKCTGYYNSEEITIMRKLIENIPDAQTLVHRDYHPNNIMITNEEMLLIDLADLSKGHPIFDWISIATGVNLAEMEPAAFEATIGLSSDKIKKLWKGILHLYFKDKNEAEINELETYFRTIARINTALVPAIRCELDKNIIAGCVQDAKINFFSNVKSLIGRIKW